MSVEKLTPNFQLISAAPIIMCPGDRLRLFQTSARIAHTHNVSSGYTGNTEDVWTFIWNSPEQNAMISLNRLY
ncbi:MAG: hypothetical protein Gaeavirus5_4 [Gaeavirus sp.]|uniref:Uncharacterized protein n=1 Tax=Gaeavirus sp. TaxID=2487767 RepID=A0A3G4ZYL1_9VIRU|nr:MAG: hypothetical protein Gaeavirus5_4 [Gaeavirus sp.]